MSRKDELYHYGVKGMKWGKRKAIQDYLNKKKSTPPEIEKRIHDQRASRIRANYAKQKEMRDYWNTPPSERYFDKDHPAQYFDRDKYPKYHERNRSSRGASEEARNRYRSSSSAPAQNLSRRERTVRQAARKIKKAGVSARSFINRLRRKIR